jgi:hypothetical protein
MAKKIPSDEEVLARWKKEICEMADIIDPGEEQTWQGIWIGFAIGCGMPIEKATSYTFYIDKAFPLEISPRD